MNEQVERNRNRLESVGIYICTEPDCGTWVHGDAAKPGDPCPQCEIDWLADEPPPPMVRLIPTPLDSLPESEKTPAELGICTCPSPGHDNNCPRHGDPPAESNPVEGGCSCSREFRDGSNIPELLRDDPDCPIHGAPDDTAEGASTECQKCDGRGGGYNGVVADAVYQDGFGWWISSEEFGVECPDCGPYADEKTVERAAFRLYDDQITEIATGRLEDALADEAEGLR